MNLVRLIYVSTVDKNFNLEQVLATSRTNNAKNNITGLMYFNRLFVIQCLEGERATINNLFQVISQDKRHNKIILLDYTDISRHDFQDWDMGYIPETSETKTLLREFSESESFEPYALNAATAYQFLLNLYYRRTSQ